LVAALTNAHFCGCSHAEVAVSNPAGGMNVCLLGMLCALQAEVSAMNWYCPVEYYRVYECDQV